jgi:hypothetical protein
MQKSLESLETTRVKTYYQGIILANLGQTGFLHQHHYLSWVGHSITAFALFRRHPSFFAPEAYQTGS